jgi:RNase P subunit RPR2
MSDESKSGRTRVCTRCDAPVKPIATRVATLRQTYMDVFQCTKCGLISSEERMGDQRNDGSNSA